MNLPFLKYFFGYIFRSKTRQKLIFLAIIGLLLSSFSLTVIQGFMGGLQAGLTGRSKNVLGNGYIDLKNVQVTDSRYESLFEELVKSKIKFFPELELELMIQNQDYVSPVILHGIDFNRNIPEFLKTKNGIDVDTSHIVLGSELARSLRTNYGSKVKITSPAHTDFIFEEIPRQVTSYISDFFSSELPEIDSAHGWVRIGFLQNLVKAREVNKIRFYGDYSEKIQTILSQKKYKDFQYISWEKEHSTLVWALNLETRVMIFIFASMSVLIGICITSGFLIFYNKIKLDLASFWILGLEKKKIFALIYMLGQILAISFCSLGIVLGLSFLLLVDQNQIMIMPEQFVERNIPVQFDFFKVFLAFIIPYAVASLFTHFTFKIFKKDNFSFLTQIRKLS